MWLINVETKLLEQFNGASESIPPYAILSHTWQDGQEVTFQEMQQIQNEDKKKDGWDKINMTCRLAAAEGLKYAWVDTCCIDKSSSAELTEAINSMFNWYKRSSICYVYLSDFSGIINPLHLGKELQDCRWFTRGWTLQELIAPTNIAFYNKDWQFEFKKSDYSDQLASLTKISLGILNRTQDLSTISVAQKMSWAASRQTTRLEDMAYCLLGIFGINMPLLYGEEEKAFSRLQDEIIRSCPDPSIFAWRQPETELSAAPFSGVLAPSPKYFSTSGEISKVPERYVPDFSTSNRGIKVRAKFSLRALDKAPGTPSVGLVLPVCSLRGATLGIQVRNTGNGVFVRQNPARLVEFRTLERESTLILDPFLLAHLRTPNNIHQKNYFLESRYHALKINLESDMSIYRRWPWQNWDDVDSLFFGPQDHEMNWAVVKIEKYIPPGFNQYPNESILFLFYAFGWNLSSRSRPRCGIQQVTGRLLDRQLEDMNDRAVAEDWGGYRVANRLKMSHIPQYDMVKVRSVAGNALLLKYTIEMVEDPNTCPIPFWRADFSWEVVPDDKAPKIVDERWKRIVPMGWKSRVRLKRTNAHFSILQSLFSPKLLPLHSGLQYQPHQRGQLPGRFMKPENVKLLDAPAKLACPAPNPTVSHIMRASIARARNALRRVLLLV